MNTRSAQRNSNPTHQTMYKRKGQDPQRKLSYLQHLGVESLAKGGKGSTTVLPKAPAPAPALAPSPSPSPSPDRPPPPPKYKPQTKQRPAPQAQQPHRPSPPQAPQAQQSNNNTELSTIASLLNELLMQGRTQRQPPTLLPPPCAMGQQPPTLPAPIVSVVPGQPPPLSGHYQQGFHF